MTINHIDLTLRSEQQTPLTSSQIDNNSISIETAVNELIDNGGGGTSLTLTTTGTGAATLTGSDLNIPTPTLSNLGAQAALTLTTTGSGAATLTGADINIPTPTVSSLGAQAALGYVPVNKAGDTMAGDLILKGDATDNLGAVTLEQLEASFHYKGSYSTESALKAAIPTPAAGDYAITESNLSPYLYGLWVLNPNDNALSLGGSAPILQSYCDGVIMKFNCGTCWPSRGTYDWTYVTTFLAALATANATRFANGLPPAGCTITPFFGGDTGVPASGSPLQGTLPSGDNAALSSPLWMVAQGVPFYQYHLPPVTGVSHTVPVVWDSTFIACRNEFITALAAYLLTDPNGALVTGVHLIACDNKAGDFFLPTGDTVTRDLLVGTYGYSTTLLINTCKGLIDFYRAAFPNILLRMAIGPIDPLYANGVTTDPAYSDNNWIGTQIANYGATTYPGWYLPLRASLSAQTPIASQSAGTIFAALAALSPLCGLQFVYPCFTLPSATPTMANMTSGNSYIISNLGSLTTAQWNAIGVVGTAAVTTVFTYNGTTPAATDGVVTDMTSFRANGNQATNPQDIFHLVHNNVYQISALGTGVNWSSIGVSGTPAVGSFFTYNNVTVTGTGGHVTDAVGIDEFATYGAVATEAQMLYVSLLVALTYGAYAEVFSSDMGQSWSTSVLTTIHNMITAKKLTLAGNNPSMLYVGDTNNNWNIAVPGSAYTSDMIAEGAINKYYHTSQAQQDALIVLTELGLNTLLGLTFTPSGAPAIPDGTGSVWTILEQLTGGIKNLLTQPAIFSSGIYGGSGSSFVPNNNLPDGNNDSPKGFLQKLNGNIICQFTLVNSATVSTYQALVTDKIILVTGNNPITITLPLSTVSQFPVTIKPIGNGTVTVTLGLISTGVYDTLEGSANASPATLVFAAKFEAITFAPKQPPTGGGGTANGWWIINNPSIYLPSSGGTITGNLAVSGTLNASNLSGTNTGDENSTSLYTLFNGTSLTVATAIAVADTLVFCSQVTGTTVLSKINANNLIKSLFAFNGALTSWTPLISSITGTESPLVLLEKLAGNQSANGLGNLYNATSIAGATKTTPVGTDGWLIADSASVTPTFQGKFLSFTNLWNSVASSSAVSSVYQTLAAQDASGGYVGKTLQKINFWNTAATFLSFFTNANTAARTYTFPDKDITVAGIADITAANASAMGYLPATTYASFSTPTTPGWICRATDVGVNGALFEYNGTKWFHDSPILLAQDGGYLLSAIPAGSTVSQSGNVVTVNCGANHNIPATTYDGFSVYYPGHSGGGNTITANWYSGFARTGVNTFTFTNPTSQTVTSGSVNSGSAYLSETTLPNMPSIPGNVLGVKGRVEDWTNLACNNSATAKVMFRRLNTTSFGNISLTTNITSDSIGGFQNNNAANSQIALTSNVTTSLGASATAQLTGTVDTTIAQTYKLSLLCATSADWAAILNYSIKASLI